jgi:uncharacterized protein (DUF2384 family)
MNKVGAKVRKRTPELNRSNGEQEPITRKKRAGRSMRVFSDEDLRRVAALLGERALKNENESTVITRATEVIGDKREALRWMGTPVRALDYATPVSRLKDREGTKAVLAVLTRIEYGVL